MKLDPLTKLCPACKLPLSQHQVKCLCHRGPVYGVSKISAAAETIRDLHALMDRVFRSEPCRCVFCQK